MNGDTCIRHEEPWRGLLWLANPPDWCEPPRHPGAQSMRPFMRGLRFDENWRGGSWPEVVCDDTVPREVKC